MATTRRAFLFIGGLAVAGGGGYLGWRAWAEGPRRRLLASGEALLAEGKLREARGLAELLVNEHADWLPGYELAVRVLGALDDRDAVAALLPRAYDVQPRGFPLLPAYVEHRLAGPGEPQSGYDALAFVDQHAGIFPEDARLVAHGRLIALAYILEQPTLQGEQRLSAIARAEKTLEELPIAGGGSTAEHFARAQVYLALGLADEFVAEARAGVAAGTDKWLGLALHWASLAAMLHNGKDEAAWNELEALEANLADWPGTHFGMGKPMVELLRLTAALRFGRQVEDPPGYAERFERLEREGIRLEAGDEETRGLIRELLVALKRRDTPGAAKVVDALLALVGRDRGSGMQAQIIRPNTESMLLVAKGNLLMTQGDFARAEATYRTALALFPSDLWLESKVSAAQLATAPGEEVDPLEFRGRGGE